MQKIFFDHQKFSTQKFGGISRYFANIIDEIKKKSEFDYLLGVANSQNYYIKDEPQFLNNNLANYFLKSEYGFRTFKTNELYCKYLLKKNNFDVFHPTYYDPYFIKFLKKPMVTTIHDMTYERLPEYFWVQDPLTSYKRISAQRADKIIAISETTKRDLLTYLEVDESKVEVIYHGIDIKTPLKLEKVNDLPTNYLFFVGDRSGYKNFYLMLDAFAVLSKKHPDLHLVLSGGGKLIGADVEIIARLKLQDKVHHYNVTDEQLNYLYSKALLFVYPSLYEGFGLPILEAFKANCPILLSDTDCFKEIAQNAAAFFYQRSLEDLINMIEKLISDKSLRENLVANGNIRLQDFPIEKSISKTLELYKSLA
ncbi:glycosyltransferase family 4 protein [Pedobacter alpinus]|uniref:Glycosyltransferase family 4 protein n=1 Tax=Pedobacter alpinus TaxID=1590643 RepID=A0ABW5TR80_9SPHI